VKETKKERKAMLTIGGIHVIFGRKRGGEETIGRIAPYPLREKGTCLLSVSSRLKKKGTTVDAVSTFRTADQGGKRERKKGWGVGLFLFKEGGEEKKNAS